MIIRILYTWLLRLHPRRFRELFADEMLSTFEEAAAERAVLPLFADGAVSLVRQWIFRSANDPPAVSSGRAHASDGVPVFYLEEQSIPDLGSLLSGGALSVVILIAACVLASMGGYAPKWVATKASVEASFKALGGKFDKSRTPIADARPAGPGEHWALVSNHPRAPIVVRPQDPDASKWGRNYLQLVRLLAALDADGDGILSAAEIAAAPAVLQKLDANHDGKLSPEECGFRGFPPGIDLLTGGNAKAAQQRRRFLERVRPEFMHFHPVIAALDADRNGEISADEILNAPAALRMLDRNGDGRITADEYLPDPVENQLTLILSRLDVNGDGRIDSNERANPFAGHYRELLDRADANHDGIVTREELKDEIRRRADLNRDGVVSWSEMLRAQQSGAFGKVTSEK